MLTDYKPWMREGLISLWMECFGDKRELPELFIDRCVTAASAIVDVREDVPAGAAYLLECDVAGAGRALYAYGVGVLPKYRRQGIFRAMMEEAEKRAAARGAVVILQAAPDALGHYIKLGYQTFGAYRVISLAPKIEEKVPLDVCPADVRAYAELRNNCFHSMGCVRWGLERVRFAMEFNALSGGFCDMLRGGEYLLFGEVDGDVLKLNETTLPHERLLTLAPALCAHYGATRLECCLPPFGVRGGRLVRTAAGKGASLRRFDGLWIGLDMR